MFTGTLHGLNMRYFVITNIAFAKSILMLSLSEYRYKVHGTPHVVNSPGLPDHRKSMVYIPLGNPHRGDPIPGYTHSFMNSPT